MSTVSKLCVFSLALRFVMTNVRFMYPIQSLQSISGSVIRSNLWTFVSALSPKYRWSHGPSIRRPKHLPIEVEICRPEVLVYFGSSSFRGTLNHHELIPLCFIAGWWFPDANRAVPAIKNVILFSSAFPPRSQSRSSSALLMPCSDPENRHFCPLHTCRINFYKSVLGSGTTGCGGTVYVSI